MTPPGPTSMPGSPAFAADTCERVNVAAEAGATEATVVAVDARAARPRAATPIRSRFITGETYGSSESCASSPQKAADLVRRGGESDPPAVEPPPEVGCDD